jgi:hypothetical protein
MARQTRFFCRLSKKIPSAGAPAIKLAFKVNLKRGEPSLHPLVMRRPTAFHKSQMGTPHIVRARNDPNILVGFHFFRHQVSLSS